jgi:hypothetical protein
MPLAWLPVAASAAQALANSKFSFVDLHGGRMLVSSSHRVENNLILSTPAWKPY